MSGARETQGRQAAAVNNASPTRSASATARSLNIGRSHQDGSGATASPTRSASATARSLNIGRSHQDGSGATASPIGRSHQEMPGPVIFKDLPATFSEKDKYK